MMRRASVTVVLALLAPFAVATDGVLEINQTCAVGTGCFPGDAPGFPVTIDGSAGHSYRLTSDLRVPNENTSGIVISADDVCTDLNGFAIVGRTTCSGEPPFNPVTCTPTSSSWEGAGSGVESDISIRGISVTNGSITGMGSYGVLVGEQSQVTNVRVRSNRVGISAYTGSIVSGNTVLQNELGGIHAHVASTVSGNTVYRNGGNGISADFGSTVSGNNVYQNGAGIYANASTVYTAYSNGIAGIGAPLGSTVSGNTVSTNHGVGIYAGTGSTVTGNTASSNQGDGIHAFEGSAIQGNTVWNSAGFGLNLGSGTTFRGNTITGNVGGAVTGSGVNMGDNYCAGVGTVSADCGGRRPTRKPKAKPAVE
jgi:parallel beta-helix repeat protein